MSKTHRAQTHTDCIHKCIAYTISSCTRNSSCERRAWFPRPINHRRRVPPLKKHFTVKLSPLYVVARRPRGRAYIEYRTLQCYRLGRRGRRKSHAVFNMTIDYYYNVRITIYLYLMRIEMYGQCNGKIWLYTALSDHTTRTRQPLLPCPVTRTDPNVFDTPLSRCSFRAVPTSVILELCRHAHV